MNDSTKAIEYTYKYRREVINKYKYSKSVCYNIQHIFIIVFKISLLTYME